MSKRVLSLLVTAIIMGQALFAQSVADGKRFFYYERYKSAKDAFEKVLAGNPNDVNAVYWLGQTLIAQKDSAGAKALYQKALSTNGNAPLVLAGMGQILLTEGKKDEARQQFETAINLSKGKDVEVMNAIGIANVKAKLGDATYAVEKLNQATQAKKFNNSSTYLILGDSYRKLIDGGNAVTSYTKALELDPKLAAAKTKIGRVYLTQNNPEYFLPAFEDATKLDPAYAPAYFELFYYWYFRDVNKAGGYLDKYIANSDPGPDMEYIKTDYTYAKGDFAGAKTRAQQLITQFGDKVSPRMYRMIAFTSDTLGDANAAKAAMDTFLIKSDSDAVLPTDYEELAKIYSKIPGSDSLVFLNYKLAIDKDTSAVEKAKLIQNAANLAKTSGNKHLQAEWLGQAYLAEKEPNARDLYNWAYAHYQAGDYAKSDSLFCGVYIPKYPDQIFGYLWCARSKQAQDTTMEKGLAVEAYKTLAQKAIELDTTADKKYKPYAVNANFFLVSYYNDIAKQKDTAIAYVNKVLEIDPANENALNVKKILTAPPKKTTTSTKTTSSSKSAATKSRSGATKKKAK
ncbi:MAG: tetratricopeptide repeat protein [Chitinophagaceae bacterium]|nr:tetratricopeptide repeat protein [Chitinophagaceae bacterium]